MKKFILSLAALCCVLPLFGQASVNYFPEALAGVYQYKQDGENCKVRISQCEDGTFTAKIIEMKDLVGEIELITGLRYDEEKKCWNKGRMIDISKSKNKGTASAFFEPDGRLCVKSSIAGIGKKSYWKKLEER